jgi:hypothetical protein
LANKIAERKRKKTDRLAESQKTETEKLLAEQKTAREDLESSQVSNYLELIKSAFYYINIGKGC